MPDLRRDAAADRDIKDAGGERWAILASLIETAKLCAINPEAWLADVLKCQRRSKTPSRGGVNVHHTVSAMK